MEQGLKELKYKPNPISIYHGTPCGSIKQFTILDNARSRLDYGKGVYFTTNREQAKKWSVHGTGVNNGYVYEVKLDYRLILQGAYTLKQFLYYNDEFINTYTFCRTYGKDAIAIQGYDIIYGLMIDGKGDLIIKECDDFELGKISKIELKRKLQALQNSDQLCIKNKELLHSMVINNIYKTEVIKGRSKSDERNIIWKK